jgi:hypothetical protein
MTQEERDKHPIQFGYDALRLGRLADLDRIDRFELFFIDKKISIYEPHGFFDFNDYHVVYGHEEIIILDNSGKMINHHNTRG